jgi:hypothetical protein
MPGGYAHLSLVNRINDQTETLPNLLQHAFGKYFHFCELGSVSPDTPYLAFGDEKQQEWADTMHYDFTFETVKQGARFARNLSGEEQLKCIAWLMGYASHLVMDGTVHPVVELKVGPYRKNKTAHRRCELHQDAHIWEEMGYGEPGVAEPFDSGPRLCHAPDDIKALDPEVSNFWQRILQAVHADRFSNALPNPDLWFRRYVQMMDDVVEEGYKLLPLSRHIMVDLLATALPPKEEADHEYLENLKTPYGRQTYDQVFKLALSNVLSAWHDLGASIANENEQQLVSIPDFNLDTGKDEGENLIWWGVA